jgi:DNA polymerase-1
MDVDWGDDVILVQSRFTEAYRMVERELSKVANNLGCFDDSILFFTDSINFRKRIDPAYKGHRNRKKPCGYRRVINKLKEEYNVVVMPELEADDAMGIQIPGDLYDFTDAVVTITEEEGKRWHFIQTLAGDQTDGYGGVPGFGVKRAEAFFEENGYTWTSIVKAFESKGLDESAALRNAQLAKILQCTDYDFDTESVKLWSPTADH